MTTTQWLLGFHLLGAFLFVRDTDSFRAQRCGADHSACLNFSMWSCSAIGVDRPTLLTERPT